MAGLADGPQLAVVRVVLDVAPATVARDRVMHVAGMTRSAFEITMPRGQRKIGALVVIEIRRLPGLDNMTARAVGPVAALVHVIVDVTGMTGAVVEIEEVFGLMAIGAVEPGMSAVERESGDREVIEGQVGPCGRRMTVQTGGPVTSVVHVVLQMAVDAFRACFGKIVAQVAGAALGGRMRACQRKS